MKKKLISLVVAGTLLSSIASVSASFTGNVNVSDWAQSAVESEMEDGCLYPEMMWDVLDLEYLSKGNGPRHLTPSELTIYETVTELNANGGDFTRDITRREFTEFLVLEVINATGQLPSDILDRIGLGADTIFDDVTVFDDIMYTGSNRIDDRIPESDEYMYNAKILEDFAIMFAHQVGIVTSDTDYYDGTHGIHLKGDEQFFRPNDPITREEASIMALRAYNVIEFSNSNPYSEKAFTYSEEGAVNRYWYDLQLSGVSGGRFFQVPFTTTYNEADYINYRDLWNYAQAPASTNNVSYSDANQISDWAISGVGFCQENGILQGADGKFDPKGNMTIEQAIMMISRIDTGAQGTSMQSADLDDMGWAPEMREQIIDDYAVMYMSSEYPGDVDYSEYGRSTFIAYGSTEIRPKHVDWFYNGGVRP